MAQSSGNSHDGNYAAKGLDAGHMDRKVDEKYISVDEFLNEVDISLGGLESFLDGDMHVLRKKLVDPYDGESETSYNLNTPVGILKVKKTDDSSEGDEDVLYELETPIGKLQYKIEN